MAAPAAVMPTSGRQGTPWRALTLLIVLALATGIVALHGVAAGHSPRLLAHGSHAHSGAPAEVVSHDGSGATCAPDCGFSNHHTEVVCLAVLGALGAMALRRRRLAVPLDSAGLATPARPVSLPHQHATGPPPSLTALCISRT